MIKLDTEKIQIIGLFESITHASVKDCLIDKEKNKMTFVVNENNAGKAIGKGGVNIKNLENKFNKKIEIIEFSEDPVRFASFLLRPSIIKDGFVSERSDAKKILNIEFSKKVDLDKSKVRKAKIMVQKYFDIDDLVVN